MLLNPTVIVEVLSPSTEAFDRGRSFAVIGPRCQRSSTLSWSRKTSRWWSIITDKRMARGPCTRGKASRPNCTCPALAARWRWPTWMTGWCSPPRRRCRRVWCVGCRAGVRRAMLSPAEQGVAQSCALQRSWPTHRVWASTVLARADDPESACIWRDMQGTQFAQFSAEVLRRGAAAVLPHAHQAKHIQEAPMAL